MRGRIIFAGFVFTGPRSIQNVLLYIMKTVKELTFGEFGLEGKFYFKLFKQWIGLLVDGQASASYAKSCIDYANNISTESVVRLFSISDNYRSDILTITGQTSPRINSRKSLAKLIQPKLLMVPAGINNSKRVAHFELDCDWEREHGMEWIIVENKIKYVGSFASMNPHGKFVKTDVHNYVNRV